MANLHRHFTKRVCSILLVLLMLHSFDHIAQPEWAKQMGGAEGDIGSGISADQLGNIYTVGTFSGTSVFGSTTVISEGKGDIFICKASATNGTLAWVRRMGGSNEENGNAVVCDPAGNVYITGRYSGTAIFGTYTLTASGASDFFVAKINPVNGLVDWIKSMGGTGNDGGLSLTSDSQGNIYTCGYFQGVATFGTFTLNPTGTNFNIFLIRTNSGGNVAWAKGYGSAGYSFGTSVSCDAGGDVYMTGYFESDVLFGTYNLSSVKYQDIFVSKHYASTGNVAWANSAGGSGNDNGNGIVAGSDGYVYSTGKFEDVCTFETTTLTSLGSADVFISKRNATTGALVWVFRYGASGYEQGSAIVQDTDHIYITGQFSGFVNFGNTTLVSHGNADAFLTKLKKDAGIIQWAIGMGGNNVDSGYGISTGMNDALFCSGFFQSVADLAGFETTSNGNTDVFIVKLTSATVGLNINEFFYNSVKIIPVPVNDDVTVLIQKQNISGYKLTLTDISGKAMLQFYSDLRSQKLNLESLSPGVYILTVDELDGEKIMKKIIKN